METQTFPTLQEAIAFQESIKHTTLTTIIPVGGEVCEVREGKWNWHPATGYYRDVLAEKWWNKKGCLK